VLSGCLLAYTNRLLYNPAHPIGTKYSVSELKPRRDDWYQALKNPVVVVLNENHVAIDRDFGPPGPFQESRSPPSISNTVPFTNSFVTMNAMAFPSS